MPRSPIKKSEQAIRIERAIELRSKGWTWLQIAEELGWKSRSAACKAVGTALQQRAEETKQTLDAHREQLLHQLDLAEQQVWKVIEQTHPATYKGEWIVVTDSEGTEHYVVDSGPNLAAVDRLIKIQERRARLIGADAPVKAEVGVRYTINGVDMGDLT